MVGVKYKHVYYSKHQLLSEPDVLAYFLDFRLPLCFDPFIMAVTYRINWVKTFWTYRMAFYWQIVH